MTALLIASGYPFHEVDEAVQAIERLAAEGHPLRQQRRNQLGVDLVQLIEKIGVVVVWSECASSKCIQGLSPFQDRCDAMPT